MDLGPIIPVRPFSAIQPRGPDPELPAVVRVENSSRPDGYSPGQQSAGQQDDELAALPEEPATETTDPGDETPSGANVSFFA